MDDVVQAREVNFDELLEQYVDDIKSAAGNLRYLLATEMNKIEDTKGHKVAELNISELVKLASDIQRHRALARNK